LELLIVKILTIRQLNDVDAMIAQDDFPVTPTFTDHFRPWIKKPSSS
jgi:hypothetical protein